jgi:ubiquinone/menaquinone biosynthesis C-methylase UbiE
MKTQEQYYAAVAATYDIQYEQPALQEDLEELQELLTELLAGHKVLELACGSGYWTEIIADTADSVRAIDNSPEMLAVAAERGLDEDFVQFTQADAFALPADIAPGQFTACFAAGLWSQVKRSDQDKYLAHLRAKLGKDVLLMLLDMNNVDGFTMPIARTDLDGNTFHFLTGRDGERYEVAQSYPSDSWLRKRLSGAAKEVRVQRLEHYWLATCRLK